MTTESMPEEGLQSGWTPPPSRGLVESIGVGLKKIVRFDGRASRSEFWWFFVGQYITAFLLVFLERLLFSVVGGTGETIIEVAGVLFLVAYQVALLAAAVRRFHDIDFVGWWVLVPFVNPFALMKAGTPGPNRFG
jgi:uncharacterized membrane protein YhaH (DUF805 family)